MPDGKLILSDTLLYRLTYLELRCIIFSNLISNASFFMLFLSFLSYNLVLNWFRVVTTNSIVELQSTCLFISYNLNSNSDFFYCILLVKKTWKSIVVTICLQLGFDSVHFARIDYQDREKRKGDKSLEVIWRGSRTFGSSSQVWNKTPAIDLTLFFFVQEYI